MSKIKKKLKPRKRAIFLALSSFAIIVAVTFSIGKYWIEILEKYQEKQDLEKELLALKEKEEELQVDANKLQNPEYMARYAREKYLYSKDGEYILQIPEE